MKSLSPGDIGCVNHSDYTKVHLWSENGPIASQSTILIDGELLLVLAHCPNDPDWQAAEGIIDSIYNMLYVLTGTGQLGYVVRRNFQLLEDYAR